MKTPKKLNWLPLILILLVAMVMLAAGAWLWRGYVIRSQEQRSFQRAQQLITEGRGGEALILIRHRNQLYPQTDAAARQSWQELEVAAATQASALSRLLALYEKSPDLFKNQEGATLLLARALVHSGNFAVLDQLRAEWQGREKLAPGWFELDVDALLVRGKRTEAIELLNGRSFEGAADCGRLARLALLSTPTNLKEAWTYLDRAAKLDPRNAEVRLFRGQILEGVGQSALAHHEFQAAFNSNTNNPFFREQLGEFLRRHGRYELAVRTWAGGLTNAQATDLLWLRTAFWTRMVHHLNCDLSTEPPYGPQTAFVKYLAALPRDRFWDGAAFEKTAEATRYQKQLQEVLWLQLLDALQNGREVDAARLLDFNSFRPQSYQPDLESALIRVLSFRKTGRLAFPVNVNIPLVTDESTPRHPLLTALDTYTREPNKPLPPELDRLLRGNNAFAAVVLAAGWAEAALNLPRDDVLPDGSPDWLTYGFMQALRFNRGNAEALAFAARQKPSPTLELLQCEILLSETGTNQALPKLERLAASDTEVGQRAAQLIIETHFDRKQYDAVRAAFTAYPAFATSVAGQVMQARLALVQNQIEEAVRIYSAIQSESGEAKIFLAKKAFQDRSWSDARRLTEELVKQYPERAEFRVMLEQIKQAEAKP